MWRSTQARFFGFISSESDLTCWVARLPKPLYCMLFGSQNILRQTAPSLTDRLPSVRVVEIISEKGPKAFLPTSHKIRRRRLLQFFSFFVISGKIALHAC